MIIIPQALVGICLIYYKVANLLITYLQRAYRAMRFYCVHVHESRIERDLGPSTKHRHRPAVGFIYNSAPECRNITYFPDTFKQVLPSKA